MNIISVAGVCGSGSARLLLFACLCVANPHRTHLSHFNRFIKTGRIHTETIRVCDFHRRLLRLSARYPYNWICVCVCVCLCAWPRGKMMRTRFRRVRVFAIVERAYSSVEHFILFLFFGFVLEKRLCFLSDKFRRTQSPSFLCAFCEYRRVCVALGIQIYANTDACGLFSACC